MKYGHCFENGRFCNQGLMLQHPNLSMFGAGGEELFFTGI